MYVSLLDFLLECVFLNLLVTGCEPVCVTGPEWVVTEVLVASVLKVLPVGLELDVLQSDQDVFPSEVLRHLSIYALRLSHPQKRCHLLDLFQLLNASEHNLPLEVAYLHRQVHLGSLLAPFFLHLRPSLLAVFFQRSECFLHSQHGVVVHGCALAPVGLVLPYRQRSEERVQHHR